MENPSWSPPYLPDPSSTSNQSLLPLFPVHVDVHVGKAFIKHCHSRLCLGKRVHLRHVIDFSKGLFHNQNILPLRPLLKSDTWGFVRQSETQNITKYFHLTETFQLICGDTNCLQFLWYKKRKNIAAFLNTLSRWEFGYKLLFTTL